MATTLLRSAAGLAAAAFVVAVELNAFAQGIFREPLRSAWPVRVVEPPAGLPLAIRRPELSRDMLRAEVQSLTLKSVPIGGIQLRAAIGPTPDGMVTFRLRTLFPRLGAPVPPILAPRSPAIRMTFVIVEEDQVPPLTLMTRDRAIVVTIERIAEDGNVVFENPDAIELLWNALGPPRRN